MAPETPVGPRAHWLRALFFASLLIGVGATAGLFGNRPAIFAAACWSGLAIGLWSNRARLSFLMLAFAWSIVALLGIVTILQATGALQQQPHP